MTPAARQAQERAPAGYRLGRAGVVACSASDGAPRLSSSHRESPASKRPAIGHGDESHAGATAPGQRSHGGYRLVLWGGGNRRRTRGRPTGRGRSWAQPRALCVISGGRVQRACRGRFTKRRAVIERSGVQDQRRTRERINTGSIARPCAGVNPRCVPPSIRRRRGARVTRATVTIASVGRRGGAELVRLGQPRPPRASRPRGECRLR